MTPPGAPQDYPVSSDLAVLSSPPFFTPYTLRLYVAPVCQTNGKIRPSSDTLKVYTNFNCIVHLNLLCVFPFAPPSRVCACFHKRLVMEKYLVTAETDLSQPMKVLSWAFGALELVCVNLCDKAVGLHFVLCSSQRIMCAKAPNLHVTFA